MRRLLHLALAFTLLLSSTLLAGCAGSGPREITSLEDVATSRLGILEGSIYDQMADEYFPDASKHFYTTTSDVIVALQGDKVDCLLTNKVSADQIIRETGNFRYLDEYISEEYIAAVVSPSKKELLDEINVTLDEMRSDGTLEALQQKWLYGPEEGKVMGSHESSGEKGSLSLVTTSALPPFAYLGPQGIIGYDIELMLIFAARQGYSLDINEMVFSGMLAAVSTGKYDLASTGITITEERAKAVLFTDPIASVPAVCLVRSADTAASQGFGEWIEQGIQLTFIQDERWRLLLSGLGVTLGLTLLSAAFGTALGLLFFYMLRSRLRIVRLLPAVLNSLSNGLPTVVILLVLAYLVFGSMPIAGFWVATIGFSLIFACGFARTMQVGVANVGLKQSEAALALGFRPKEVFRLVVLPQALTTILKLYSGQLADLLKSTAIVGYIAVDDLTRASDLIRSVTFDAFFSLLASALVYLLIIWLAVAGLRAAEKRTGSGRSKRARQRIAPLVAGQVNR